MDRGWIEDQLRRQFGTACAGLGSALSEVRACFTSRVAYSKTGIRPCTAARRAMPRASPSLSELATFLAKKTSSIAAASG